MKAIMKAITGNRLADGGVVYLAPNGSWTEDLGAAEGFGPDKIEAALEGARRRKTEIAAAYAIEVSAEGAPAGREAFRERIRRIGPTVRPDLGRREITT